MAISRVKTWVAAEVLTAADQNAEFDNVLNNALGLISPLTGNLSAGGNDITGLDELAFNDAAANATAAGRVRRNAANLTWHDGTAAGRVFYAGGTDVPVADGGTGLSSGTSGGILGYTAAGTLASSVALTANAIVIGGGAGATPTPMTGTSGGVPYFNAATTVASSAALTQYGLLYGGGAGAAPVALGAMTNGQIVIGSTSAAPVVASLTAGTNITITPAAGAITIASTAAGLTAASGTFTRDMTTASGTQNIAHGLAVTPAVIWLVATSGAAGEASVGIGAGVTDHGLHDNRNVTANTWVQNANSVHMFQGAGTSYEGQISAIDGTNITITWTRNGTPTGTISGRWVVMG